MKSILTFLSTLALSYGLTTGVEANDAYDVVVYGATPGGIAAALAAADDGCSVALVDPTRRIGGLVTSGLSHSDFHSFEGLSGTFLDFILRVEKHYLDRYGKDSPQVRSCFRGTHGEPEANWTIFKAMIDERKSIVVKLEHRLDDVLVKKGTSGGRIDSATFRSPDGKVWTAKARIFIDGSYEGDLMAKANVPWRVGREGKNDYGESLAPEKGDSQLQAYNFRFIMTRDPAQRIAPKAPAGYRREDFLAVVESLESGKIKFVFGYPSGCIFKSHEPPLPNGKFDINDVSGGLVRLSLPGVNRNWPDGDAATRARIFAEHLRDQAGLLYFLQNDEAVPKKFRDEAREWGWCKDEFVDSDHLPPQLYVREARRMIGTHVFTEADSAHAPGDARAVLKTDAIAMGEYGNNCHGTDHVGPRFGGKHVGEFYKGVPPYQIPYGVIVPQEIDNLLVPVAVSSTHVGFCALRLEPIWTSLGQAAGHAAHQAIAANVAVQKVDVPKLQSRLHAAGSATIYVTDVLPGHPDFAIVQKWGTAGGLHGLAPMPAKPGQRGKHIVSQYFEANPGHEVKLDEILDATLAERWLRLGRDLGLPADRLLNADGRRTRGEWLRTALPLKTPSK